MSAIATTDQANGVFTLVNDTTNNGTLTIASSNPLKVGTYNMVLVGKTADEAAPVTDSGIYTSTSLPFTVTITNNCVTSAVTTFVPADVGTSATNTTVYNINSAQQTYTFTTWTAPFSYCGTFNYSISSTNSSVTPGLTGSLAGVFTFDTATRTFTVHTNDITKASIYAITITGTMSGAKDNLSGNN